MTASEQSLLTDEANSWIGFTTEFAPEPVIRRDVLRFLVATGASLPDENAVDLRVPPMFYRTLGRRIAPVEALRDDGLWPGLRPTIGVGQVLAAGIEVEFFREVEIGDVLAGRRHLVSLTEKSGRKRDFILALWEMVLSDARKEPVLCESVTEIMY